MGLESRHAKVITLKPGLGAVSNADFLTPCPKLTGLKDGLQALLIQDHPRDEDLMGFAAQPASSRRCRLPATGISLELERALSAAFVSLPNYGTRACSVIRFEVNQIHFQEQAFDAQGHIGTRKFTLRGACRLADFCADVRQGFFHLITSIRHKSPSSSLSMAVSMAKNSPVISAIPCVRKHRPGLRATAQSPRRQIDHVGTDPGTAPLHQRLAPGSGFAGECLHHVGHLHH